MNRKSKRTLSIFFLTMFTFFWTDTLKAQNPVVPTNIAFAQVITNSHEDELYNRGMQSLDEGKYQEALQQFSALSDMKGRRTDAALYWKAYANNKMGRRTEALAGVAELRRAFPQSKWLKDAGALELEIKQAQGRPVNPEAESNCELKIMALNSLMNSDQERAVTMLENVLKSNSCPKAKDKALFVLSQSSAPAAQQTLARIAQAQQSPELQRKAIEYIGLTETEQSERILADIYKSATSSEIKRAVIQAYVASDAKAELAKLAHTERDRVLRNETINALGAVGAREELHEMYRRAQSADDKEAIIHAVAISDDTAFLTEIAKSAADINVRRAAVEAMGVSGVGSRRTLVEIYQHDPKVEMREAAIEGLFVNDADDELIALAREEKDPQMKKRIVEKLAVMDSRKAKDYMIELLNK
jgi:HEAT repeats